MNGKRVCCFALAVLFVILCTSCGRTNPTIVEGSADDRPDDVPSVSVTAESFSVIPEQSATTAIQTSSPAGNGSHGLEPEQEDLDLLGNILFWGSFFSRDYDSEKGDILDYIWASGALAIGMEAYGLLREGDNYEHCEYYVGTGRIRGGTDPRGYYATSCYRKIRADVMEYYLENVFHNYSYSQAREKHQKLYDTGEEVCCYYYEDGWYYFLCEHYGLEDISARVRKYDAQPNGRYLVTVDLVGMEYGDDGISDSDPITTLQADAALTMKDGRRLWTIYSTKITYQSMSADEEP
ncbi:MAG: hypothetical protein IJT44_04975 [Clostridia bacterium]|nr:hypothetical protein [Clostridia bacterium]